MSKAEITKTTEQPSDMVAYVDPFGTPQPLSLPQEAVLPVIEMPKEHPYFDRGRGPKNLDDKLRGYVLFYYSKRNYWSKSYDEKGSEPSMPDCFSHDGKFPAEFMKDFDGNIIAPQNSNCTDCPRSQWGTGKNGKGQACQSAVSVWILLEGDIIPHQMTIRATSLNKKLKTGWWAFITQASTLGRNGFYPTVLAELSLHEKTDGTAPTTVLDIVPVFKDGKVAIAGPDDQDLCMLLSYWVQWAKQHVADMVSIPPAIDDMDDYDDEIPI